MSRDLTYPKNIDAFYIVTAYLGRHGGRPHKSILLGVGQLTVAALFG